MNIFDYLVRGVVPLIIVASAMLSSCQDEIPIAGKVKGSDGQVVTTGQIVVYCWDKDATKPKKVVIDINEGQFSSVVPAGKKFIVNVHAPKYGLVSKVFYDGIPNRTYELQAATETSMTNSNGATVTAPPSCSGSLSARADWDTDPMKSIPIRLNSQGKIAGFGRKQELKDAYAYHASLQPCSSPVQVQIPPNSFNGGTDLTVAMTQIDVFSPDGMPGDFGFNNNGKRGMMESLAAFSIRAYDSEREYNLNGQTKVQAILPLKFFSKDTLDFPKEIPLFYYNEETGEWNGTETANYDTSLKAFVVYLPHFSAINFDLDKVNPACVSFRDSPGLAAATDDILYSAELTVPSTTTITNPRVVTRDVRARDLNWEPTCTDKQGQFALTRLPPTTEVNVAFYDQSTPTVKPLGVYVVRSGSASDDLKVPMDFDCTDFGLCPSSSAIDFTAFSSGEDDDGNPSTPEVFYNDVYITACRTGGFTGDVTVSLAIAPVSAVGFVYGDYELRITGASCGAATIALPQPTIGAYPTVPSPLPSWTATPGTDTSVKVLLLIFHIAATDVCSVVGASLSETIALWQSGTGGSKVSKTMPIELCD
jgi:hypothetical protein